MIVIIKIKKIKRVTLINLIISKIIQSKKLFKNYPIIKEKFSLGVNNYENTK